MRLREVLEEDDARVERGLLNSLRSEHIQLKVGLSLFYKQYKFNNLISTVVDSFHSYCKMINIMIVFLFLSQVYKLFNNFKHTLRTNAKLK